jgi:aminotransferase
MDQSCFIAKHVVNLPKSGIRDFFDIVAKMKDAISLGADFQNALQPNSHSVTLFP